MCDSVVNHDLPIRYWTNGGKKKVKFSTTVDERLADPEPSSSKYNGSSGNGGGVNENGAYFLRNKNRDKNHNLTYKNI